MTAAIVDDIQRIRGVTAAAASSSMPIVGSDWNSPFIVEGRPLVPLDRTPSAAITLVTPAYFETMATRLLAGRVFNAFDRRDSASVAVVNASLAAESWPGENPIGKRLKRGWRESPEKWREVVGVVDDVKYEGLTEPTPLQIYLPFVQDPPRDLAITVRTATDPGSVRAEVERVIQSVDRDLPVFSVQTMERRLDESISPQRLAVLVLSVFATVALALAAIGLYGVMAHAASERTHEIGVRMALGATQANVLRMVVAGGVKLTVVGTIAGACGAFLLTRSLEGLLFGVQPTDPATFAAVSVLLFAVGLAACYIPAWRATRVEPIEALRVE
jgi:putative ABC transport system permease protein